MSDVSIPASVEALRRTFTSGRTRDRHWRVRQLNQIKKLLSERQEEFVAALSADLGKPFFEAWTSEFALVNLEIDHTLKHLDEWLKPEKVATPLVQQPGSCSIVREPLGVVLIIGPWNYPVQLVLSPLIGAIAAGNCAVLKPSEVTPHTSAALARYVPDYLDRDAVTVIEGGVPETSELLEQRFDHIFYTGGGTVGRIVMMAAAKQLTPVTLELGGKSPCLIDRAVDLDVACKRIAWGKFMNAGQTCVAPDYILVHRSLEMVFLDKLSGVLREFYGPDPRMSPDYGRIVNDRHFQRVSSMLSDGDVVIGGETNEQERYIAPTVLRNPDLESRLMRDEIFGPLLPVLAVSSIDEALSFVNARPRPLALYIFSADKAVQQQVISQTSSGGICVNETVTHLAVPDLPFGGVGPSGIGAYHGRQSFETFSHQKSVFEKSTVIDIPLRYPPYTDSKLKWVRRLL